MSRYYLLSLQPNTLISLEKYFNVRYEFDRQVVLDTIDRFVEDGKKGYICVADGVTLATSQNYPLLRDVLENSVLNTCDSGWVPVYLKWIYGIKRDQYSGTNLFKDIVAKKKYNMLFLGASNAILKPLRESLSKEDERIAGMFFMALPFRSVDAFDYEKIAARINEESPDIIWISLGMPKQEIFMYNLLPKINQGILIGVGAAFKYASGIPAQKRSPDWLVKCKLEWLYRILKEPKKQLGRCWLIIKTVPGILKEEYKRKRKNICIKAN